MTFKMRLSFFSSVCCLFLLLLLISSNSCEVLAETSSHTRAFFIFGDSYVDTGNNNYIKTSRQNRANHASYGQNFFGKQPTGRFSNGRVIVDFIAEYAKLPSIPPYLEPSADFSHGVNFASGGAGVLSSTNPGLAIDLEAQLEHFKGVARSFRKKLGEAKAKELISNAIYFISMGINEYLVGYVRNPQMQELHQPEEYVGMVIGNLTRAIQGLYEKGARKFGFFSLSPLGYFPSLRAQNRGWGCFKEASALALAHNKALNTALKDLEKKLSGFKYYNSDFYSWLKDTEKNPFKYSFKDGEDACCGVGPYRGIFTCGSRRKNYKLCDNVDDYVWWDAFHPTERIHEQFPKVLWRGRLFSTEPYNLEDLFSSEEESNIANRVEDNTEIKHIF